MAGIKDGVKDGEICPNFREEIDFTKRIHSAKEKISQIIMVRSSQDPDVSETLGNAGFFLLDEQIRRFSYFNFGSPKQPLLCKNKVSSGFG